MRTFLIGCASASLAGVALAGTTDLDAIVARNTEARGGAAAIESVSDFEADLQIVEPEFVVDGVYVATRDGRMRIDIFAEGERVFTEAIGRDRAWSWNPDAGVTAVSATGRAALRHGIELPFKLFGLHEMEARGHRLAAAGLESIGGTEYAVLLLTLDDGFETRLYVNAKTGLIERERQYRALHVDVDPTPTWIETEYLDWREVAGVLYPHRTVERDVATGRILATVTTRALRINTSPSNERFELMR